MAPPDSFTSVNLQQANGINSALARRLAIAEIKQLVDVMVQHACFRGGADMQLQLHLSIA
jgi:hypothetical protein